VEQERMFKCYRCAYLSIADGLSFTQRYAPDDGIQAKMKRAGARAAFEKRNLLTRALSTKTLTHDKMPAKELLRGLNYTGL